MKKHTPYVAILAALAAVALIAQVAFAHTHVREAIPADEAKVDAAPTDVSVSFGEEGVPAQPGQFSEATLEVYDACGRRVDNEDSSADMATSTVSATAGGTVAGRYEMHWHVVAADGAAQSGVIDYTVKAGGQCARVTRPDAADDVDLGIDVTNVSSTRTDSGAKITIKTAASFGCPDLATTAKQAIELNLDTNGDETSDITGKFVCKDGKPKLVIEGDGEKIATLTATRPTPTSISVAIPRGSLTPHLGLSVTTTKEGDDCADKICVDFAPDLGWLRVF